MNGQRLKHNLYQVYLCGLDPATQMSTTPNFIVQCAWFQAACNPRSFHGLAMLHLILYVVKQQVTICFKSSLTCVCWCLWASTLTTVGLHLNAQYDQTWHLSTQLRSGERTVRHLLWSTTLLLPTLLCDSQFSISLVIHHHHHFICSIIQQYAHLRKYDSRRAGQKGPIKTLTAALKRSIKTVTGCIFYHANKNITNEKN